MSRKEEFKHDFSGNCAPDPNGVAYPQASFSVGIFQWLLKISGKGLKKSAVKYRVRGSISNYQLVYKRAEEICNELDEEFPNFPIWLGYKKSEFVR